MKKTKLRRGLIIAAAAVLAYIAIIASFNVYGRLGFGCVRATGNPSITGTAVDGVLYYEVPHQGIYKYTPEKGSEQILWKYWYDEYTVNSYAVYYTSGDTVYVIPHDTGESKELYKQTGVKGVSIDPCGDNIIVVLQYDNNNSVWIIIDGKTGKKLDLIWDESSENPIKAKYSVGNRRITIKQDNNGYSITENGKSLLKKDESLSAFMPVDCIGDSLVFSITEEENERKVLVLRPDGRDSTLKFNPEEGEGISGGDENYIFDRRLDDNIVCVDAYTGKTWDIARGKDFAYKSVLAADSDYLYIIDNNTHESVSCLKIIYDSKNRPESLKFVEENILK